MQELYLGERNTTKDLNIEPKQKTLFITRKEPCHVGKIVYRHTKDLMVAQRAAVALVTAVD